MNSENSELKKLVAISALSGVSLAALNKILHSSLSKWHSQYLTQNKDSLLSDPAEAHFHIASKEDEDDKEDTDSKQASVKRSSVLGTAGEYVSGLTHKTVTLGKDVAAEGLNWLYPESEHVYAISNPSFLPAAGAVLGTGYLSYLLSKKLLGKVKSPEEKRLERAKKEFRRALLEKESEATVTDFTSVCGLVMDRLSAAMEKDMEKEASSGLTTSAVNVIGVIAALSGTLAYLQEKKRRRQMLDEAWRRMAVSKDPKIQGLLATAVNLPSNPVSVGSLKDGP